MSEGSNSNISFHGKSANDLVADLRKTFHSRKTFPISWRIQQLKQLENLVSQNEKNILEAIHKDIGRGNTEGFIGEIGILMSEINYMVKNLSSFLAPEQVSVPYLQLPFLSKCEIRREPLGVVLIIGAWNYPISLVLGPLIGAISAGNCAVLKPSEVTPNSSKIVAELVPKYLDTSCYIVVEGGVPETTELLKVQFDHIFYTGNGAVGKIVLRAAAEYLTPVTLELGGKSPCIVDKDVDMDVAAKRIVWGKWFNCGQTCISVDHIFVHETRKEQLLQKMTALLKQFYGEDPQTSPDYARIVSERHAKRVSSYLEELEKSNILVGGKIDLENKYIAPTILVNVPETSKVMQEEIFGPLVPVFSYTSLEDVVEKIKQRPKPLVIYMFSNNSANKQYVLENTSSGQLVFNEILHQYSVLSLPFGGVGESGMGAYHGKYGLETFSHKKSILDKTTWFDASIRYPPYKDSNLPLFHKLQYL